MPVLDFLTQPDINDSAFIGNINSGIGDVYNVDNICIQGSGSGEQFSRSFTAQSTVWTTMIMDSGSATSIVTNTEIFRWNGNGQGILRLRTDSSTATTLNFEYWNGATWTLIGSGITSGAGVDTEINLLFYGRRFDVEIIMNNTTGAFRLYMDSVLLREFTGDTILDTETQVDEFIYTEYNSSSNIDNFIANLCIADEDTRDWVFSIHNTSSDGTNNAWSGGEADVDDTVVGNTALNTVCATNTADARQSFNMAAQVAAVQNAYTPVAAGWIALARKANTGGLNIQPHVRISGVDYETTAISTLDTQWKNHFGLFYNDPSTASPWADAAAIDAAEFGFQSETA
jgi:hypothetical protein